MNGNDDDTQKSTQGSNSFSKKRSGANISETVKVIGFLILLVLWCASLFLLAEAERNFNSSRTSEASQTEEAKIRATNELAHEKIQACVDAYKEYRPTSININKQDVIGKLKIVEYFPNSGNIKADFTYIFPYDAEETSFNLDYGNGWVASYRFQGTYESFLIPHHVLWPTCNVNLYLRRISAEESSD